MVEADGYASVRGDTRSRRIVDGALEMEVRLQRSFEVCFEVGMLDETGSRVPLQGAEVRTVGGSLLGTTLEDGRVHLALAYDPGRVEITLEGFEVAHWEGFRRGKRTRAITHSLVEMAREE